MRFVVTAISVLWTCFPVCADDIGIDRVEVTIGAFAEYVDATGTFTDAESAGGMVFEAGWVAKPGWNWRTPYGVEGAMDEPAVHITYDEASAYCQWRGSRLPTRNEWVRYAYTEARAAPPAPFVTGKTTSTRRATRPMEQTVLAIAATPLASRLTGLTTRRS